MRFASNFSPDAIDGRYLVKLEFPAHSRFWFNNYDDKGKWKSATKFVLPEIEKVFSRIKRRGGLAKATEEQLKSASHQLGIYFSGTPKEAIVSLIRPEYDKFLQRAEINA